LTLAFLFIFQSGIMNFGLFLQIKINSAWHHLFVA